MKKNGFIETILIGAVVAFTLTIGTSLTLLAEKTNEDKTKIENIELKNFKKN